MLVFQKQDKIIEKYKELFNENKDFYSILKECNDLLNNSKNISFKITDFRNNQDFEKNINTIKLYRKYTILDDFINSTLNENKALILKNNQIENIDYKYLIQALDIFEETFKFEDISFVKNKILNKIDNFDVFEVKSINDIFCINKNVYCIYNLTLFDKNILVYNHNDYDFYIELPFKNIEKENKNLISAYCNILKKYIIENYDKFDFSKKYTTIFKKFGYTLEDYNKKEKNLDDKYNVYIKNVLPFLKVTKEIKHKPNFLDITSGLSNKIPISLEFMFSNDEERNKQHIIYETDYREYFRNLTYSKELIEEYCNQYWIKLNDIGDNYIKYIDYNTIKTEEDMNIYRANIIAKKKYDIIINILIYKKWGLFKYDYLYLNNNNEIKKDIEYKNHILKFLDYHITNKKDFDTIKDNRINLDDSNSIFGLKCQEYNNIIKFDNYNVFWKENIFDCNDNSTIRIDICKFIEKYNDIFNENLEIKDIWFFNFKYIDFYINNSICCFCKKFLISGVEKYDFERLLQDEYFLKNFPVENFEENMLTLKDLTIPSKKIERILHLRRSYEKKEGFPQVVLQFNYPRKEIVKILKGIHPIFKSLNLEQIYKNNHSLK